MMTRTNTQTIDYRREIRNAQEQAIQASQHKAQRLLKAGQIVAIVRGAK